MQLLPIGYGPGFPLMSGIYDVFIECDAPFAWHQFCDHALDREAQQADSAQATDPQRSAELWANIGRTLVNLAVWLPLTNQAVVDIVSPRLHNYEYSPEYQFLPAQSWVK